MRCFTNNIRRVICLGAFGLALLFQNSFSAAQKSSSEVPVISFISPSPIIGANHRQWVNIHGSGFSEGFTVYLRADAIEAHVTNQERLQWMGPEDVKINVTFGTEAARWCLQIINPDDVRSSCFTVEVVAPVPVIESIIPLRKTAGEEGFTLTIHGVFANNSYIHWQDKVMPTQPILSSDKANAVTIGLEAFISKEEITKPGEIEIRVHTPPPGGGLSPPVYLFTLARPFYQTFWFYGICIIGLMLSGIGLYHYRKQHLLLQFERDRHSIANDLHDDIGSKIASLVIFLDYINNPSFDLLFVSFRPSETSE